MKKRRLLFGCMLPLVALTLSACDFLPENFFSFPKRNDDSSEVSSSSRERSRNPKSSEHVHKFSEQWDCDSFQHWHPAICGHNEKSDIGPHEYYSVTTKQATCSSEGEIVDICTVCDYQRITTIPRSDHNWHEYSRTEPTCTSEGYVKRLCSTCGAREEYVLPMLEHDYVMDSVVGPTCSSDGYYKYRCRVCGEIREERIQALPHTWSGNPSYVYPESTGVAYSVDTCRNCGAKKIMLKATDAALEGSYKYLPNGNEDYIKLGNNNNTLTFNFDYPSMAYGTVYQHAVYENWNSSNVSQITYHGLGNASSSTYNFDLNVNGQSVNLIESGQVPYEALFMNGEYIEEFINNGYSPVADCLIGDITLNNGRNTITYMKTGGYSLYIDYLVLIVKDSNHVHSVSSYWNTDGEYHWQECVGSNCPVPNTKLNFAAHTFGESNIIVQPTCSSEGIQREICTTCHYMRDTYIPKTDHNYQAVGSFAKEDESVMLEEYYCSSCNNYVLQWNALDYNPNLSMYYELNGDYIRFQSNMAQNRNGIEQEGARIVYSVNLTRSLYNVGLAFKMAQSQGYPVFDTINSSSMGYIINEYGEMIPAEKRYGLRVNGMEIPLGEDNYGNVKNAEPKWYDWPVSFNLNAGMNTIEIYCLSSSYRGRMYEFQITNIPYITPNHNHVSDGSYSFDDTYHYLTCVDDGYRLSQEYHTFSEPTTFYEPTCSSEGMQVRTCTICGYQEFIALSALGHSNEQIGTTYGTDTCNCYYVEYHCNVCGTNTYAKEYAEHIFDSAGQAVTNSLGYQYSIRQCAVCNRTLETTNLSNCTVNGTYDGSRITKGTTMTFKVPAYKTGNISIYLPIKVSSSSNMTLPFDPSLYQFTINGENVPTVISSGTYADIGASYTDNKYLKFAEYHLDNSVVAQGEFTLTITSNVDSYRPYISGDLRIEY